jgi:hypothetical protein
MTVIMKISEEESEPEDIHGLTFEVMNTLNSETDLKASLPEEQGEVGDKGTGVEIGEIILAAFTSGAVVAVFEVIKAYCEREPSMQIDLKRADGEQITIKAEQVSGDQFDQTIVLAKRFLKENNG